MSLHRSCPDLRRRSGGLRNYFGDGTLGDVVISADTSITSAQDGDMIVLNYKSLTINAGKTLTVANRCRGLLVYVQGDAVINGSISMTARGCHANPTDSAVTTNTPVAPGDGHAVPSDGVTLRRLAKGYTSMDEDDDLMHGCGVAAVAAEANQPKVSGNGRVIKIPRVGGAGTAIYFCDAYGTIAPAGGTATNATGGGGAGGASAGNTSGGGAAGTCFSGGSGGGAVTSGQGGQGGAAYSAIAYGGQGGSGGASDMPCTGGAGNPGGNGTNGAVNGDSGTGGLLILIVGGTLSGAGTIVANGADGGDISASQAATGGGSGGGVVAVMYAGGNSFTGSITANGGVGGVCTASYKATGGPGGAGAVIGPHKIDPA